MLRRSWLISGVFLFLTALPVWSGEIKVLTFNTWGIKGARDIETRMKLIPKAVAELSPDIIVFQEVFEESELKILEEGLIRAGYPKEGFRSYPFKEYGSGIMVASRWRILEDRFAPYESFTWPESKETLGRGMISLRIKSPEGDFLFITTHIFPANLADIGRVEAMLEFYELSVFIYQESARTGIGSVIVAGDLNAEPRKLAYQLFSALSGLDNAFDYLHPNDPSPTYDRRADVYALTGIQRIDHILFGNLPGSGPGLKPIKADVVFNQPFPPNATKPYYLSDHFGMFAVFENSSAEKKIGTKEASLLEPGLSPEEKARLKEQLKHTLELEQQKDLWEKLSLAVLKSQDHAHKRDASLVKTAAKILVALTSGDKPSLSQRERENLLRWLEGN